MKADSRNAVLAGVVVLAGLGLAACGGATTNAERTGTTPYAKVASMGPPLAPEVPRATVAGGRPWWSRPATPASGRSSAPAVVVHVSIEDVKTPEGSEPAYVGPDGKVGASNLFSVKARTEVEVVVDNESMQPHSFTSPALGLNVAIGPETKVPFRFDAPGPGSYEWYCDVPCGPWVMSHVGYMKGNVTVVG